MTKYRTYIDLGKNYECYGTHNAKRTIKLIDNIMETEKKEKKILVVECNYDENYEFPIFLCTSSNDEDYYEFREKLIEQHECKCFKKTFH